MKDIILKNLKRGNKLIGKKRYKEAIEYFNKVLDLDNKSDSAYVGLTFAYYNLGNYPKSLETIANAILLRPSNIEFKKQFLQVLDKSKLRSFVPIIANILFECMQVPDFISQTIPLARIQINAKIKYLQETENSGNLFIHYKEVFLDKLFLELLYKSVNANREIELLLTEVRKQILFAYPNSVGETSEVKKFSTAIALASFNNCYVFYFSLDEQEMLTKLERDITRNFEGEDIADLESKLILYAMYKPLFTLICAAKLLTKTGWASSFQVVLEQTLVNTQVENKIKENLPQLGTISDATSQKVKEQYEEFPYPRWLVAKKHQAYKTRLEEFYSRATVPKFLSSKLEVLVAGAGTGRHPISLAKGQPMDQFTAIDISASSLAYGMRMANESKIHNIDFKQGDLLNVGELGKKFNIIESVGVLHHMKNPMQGWQALVDVLHDKGLMYIGLYSETARQNIVKARSKIAELKVSGKSEEMRNFRYQVLNDEHPEFSSVMQWSDFFSMPECRDLLFHVQEHRFTLPQIQEALDTLGLRFVGMVAPKKITNYAQELRENKQIPKNLQPSQLKYWELIEEKLPNAFSSMYKFWCVKKSEH